MKKFRFLSVLLLSLAVTFVVTTSTSYAASFVVDSNLDDDDGDCGGGTNGVCTFRDALSEAGGNAEADTITFSTGPTTITITTANLNLSGADSNGVDINGAGNITLSGGDIDGMSIGDNSTFRGFTVDGFRDQLTVVGSNVTIGGTGISNRNVFQNGGSPYNAIAVSGGNTVDIINNYINVESDGTTVNAAYSGILIQSSDNVNIGDGTTDGLNVVGGDGGSGFCGIFMQNDVDTITIDHNYIGVGSDGSTDVGNGWGICTNSGQTYDEAIIIRNNVIAGNDFGQVQLQGNFEDLTIAGNYIGINSDGDTANAGNGGPGIQLSNAHCDALGHCLIGDEGVSKRNIISGNQGYGIEITNDSSYWRVVNNYIGLDADGDTDVGNNNYGITINEGNNILIGSTDGTIDNPNVISGNANIGIFVMGEDSDDITIAENYIGMSADLSTAIQNDSHGISTTDCGTLTIGDITATSANFSNIIAGNASDGIFLGGNVDAVGIYGNSIGVVGDVDFGNGDDGIDQWGTSDDVITIGNTRSAGYNQIGGNGSDGIVLQSGNNHVIKGNLIGVNTAMTGTIGNDSEGIRLESSGPDGVTIGGTAEGEGNVFGGHTGGSYDVIVMSGSDNVEMYGNYVGVSPADGSALASSNGLGIQSDGATIGANSTYGRNYFGGHTGNQSVHFYGATNATMVHNYIGVNSSDTAVTTVKGILIDNASDTITIGGSSTGEGNVISNATGHGIQITDATDVIIMGNDIGLAPDSDTAMGNGGDGININHADADGIYIGRNIAGNTWKRNVISANDFGIQIEQGDNVYIEANVIGLNGDQNAGRGNTNDGIRALRGDTIYIGRASSDTTGNVLSGNGDNGAEINDVSGALTNVFFQKNLVGTNSSFEDYGNSTAGLLINSGAQNVVVGYSRTDTITQADLSHYANKFSFNGGGGDNDITLDGASTKYNTIRGNWHDLNVADTTPNYVINGGGAQDSVSLSGTSITENNPSHFAGTTDFSDGSIIDIFTFNVGSPPSFVASTAVASNAFSTSVDLDQGDYIYYQVTDTNGNSTTYSNPVIIKSVAVSAASGTTTNSNSTSEDGTQSETHTPPKQEEAKTYESHYSEEDDDQEDVKEVEINEDLEIIEEHEGSIDSDGDGLPDDVEDKNQNEIVDEDETDPLNADTDGDGLLDGYETRTDPLNSDTDGDGLSDGKEVLRYGTNPLTNDSDNDMFYDRYELFQIKTDPLDQCDPGNTILFEDGVICTTFESTFEELAEEIKDEKEKQRLITEAYENARRENLSELRKALLDVDYGDSKWSMRYFKAILNIPEIQDALRSEDVKNHLLEIFQNPNEPASVLDALTLSLLAFDHDKNDNIVDNGLESDIIVSEALKSDVIHKFVHFQVGDESKLTREDALFMIFRAGRAILRLDFKNSLFEDFKIVEVPFIDLDLSSRTAPYLLYFYSSGIISGFEDGYFRPSQEITHAEFAKILVLARQYFVFIGVTN